MADMTTAPDVEAGASMPDDLDDRDFEKDVLAAAAAGDHLGFAAAAERCGGLDSARELVRAKGVVRSVDRVVATLPKPELRVVEDRAADVSTDGDGNTMFGHFAVFDQWTEIDSWFEGHFLERLAPGSFKKTMRENRANVRALFQHGHDPAIGDKPLGPIDDLREDDLGAYYEVPLLDARYVREDIAPGLRAGVYGASFRFRAMREEFDNEPGSSKHNPDGLPERTLTEVRLFEFGPVTFPAYEGATASLRSRVPLRGTAPSAVDAAQLGTSEPERRETPVKKFQTREDWLQWIESI